MSYDVWLEADLGGAEPLRVGDLSANYTWNVSPMFYKAIGESPNDWNGKPASEVAQKCAAILSAFASDPAAYKALNPKNGWGDFEGAARFIWNICLACVDAPKATVRVC